MKEAETNLGQQIATAFQNEREFGPEKLQQLKEALGEFCESTLTVRGVESLEIGIESGQDEEVIHLATIIESDDAGSQEDNETYWLVIENEGKVNKKYPELPVSFHICPKDRYCPERTTEEIFERVVPPNSKHLLTIKAEPQKEGKFNQGEITEEMGKILAGLRKNHLSKKKYLPLLYGNMPLFGDTEGVSDFELILGSPALNWLEIAYYKEKGEPVILFMLLLSGREMTEHPEIKAYWDNLSASWGQGDSARKTRIHSVVHGKYIMTGHLFRNITASELGIKGDNIHEIAFFAGVDFKRRGDGRYEEARKIVDRVIPQPPKDWWQDLSTLKIDQPHDN